MNVGRIKLTLLLVSLAELFNKLIPLFVIRIGQNRLGIESLGQAQFAIYIVELFLPIMAWGFDVYGPISLRKFTVGSEEWKTRLSDLMTTRLLLSLIVFIALVGSVFLVDKFVPYRSTVLVLSILMLLSGFTTTYVHTADQSLGFLARVTIIAKVLSLVAIGIFIHDPADAILFAILSYGVNLMIGLASTFYIIRRYGFFRPRFGRIFTTFKNSLPYAITFILAILVERVELWFAEDWGGAQAVGVLTGPLKLYQGLLFAILSFSVVFYSEGLAFPEKVGRYLRLTIWVLASLILPLTIGVFFVGEPLLVLLTGQGFQGQGQNLAFICTGLFGHTLLIIAGAQALSALGRVKWTNYAYGIAFILSVGLSMVLMRMPNPYWALLGPAIAKTVAGLALLIIALKKTAGFKNLRLPLEGIGLGLGLMTTFLVFSADWNWVYRLLVAAMVYSVGYASLSFSVLAKIVKKEGLA